MTTRPATAVDDPWQIDDADLPHDSSIEDVIRFCLQYAILAPNGHNAQPWWFAVDDNAVTVGLDVGRGLAVVDPLDREATMSIGAAIFTLRVALAHFGLATSVYYWPDPLDPESCATVVASYEGTVDTALLPLFEHITRRHTSRAAFEPGPLPVSCLDQLVSAATAEHTAAHVYTDVWDRERLATLVSRADRQQMSDPSFRRELAMWLRSTGSPRRDGIHGYAEGSPLHDLARIAPLVVRTFDLGESQGAHDQALAAGSPAMIVLSTPTDEPSDWLNCGQALGRVALGATAAGLSVGFLDQIVEVGSTRNSLALMVDDGTQPQLLLRVGHGAPALPQPRRPVSRAMTGDRRPLRP